MFIIILGQCTFNSKILLIFSGADGGFSRWSFWSECSLTCGGGVQSRTRTCTNPLPQGYGEDCDGPLQETRACNDTPCPEGKDSTLLQCVVRSLNLFISGDACGTSTSNPAEQNESFSHFVVYFKRLCNTASKAALSKSVYVKA